jgi:steroid 5-alpha reductase family enzyme
VQYLSGWLWLSVIGPLWITFLLLFVTGIPTTEKSAEDKYGDKKEYKEYKKKTSLLIPWPFKN